jgi:hypothetical protein
VTIQANPFLYGTALLATMITACAAKPAAVEAIIGMDTKPAVVDISSFVPKQTTVRLEQRGDFDDDGDEDILLVLQNLGGDEPQFKPRTLVLLRRNAGGQLEKSIDNSKAILCQRCGSFMLEDSLESIHIAKNGFSLRFEGLSRVMWSRDYRFEYSDQANTWQLREFKGGVTDRVDGRSCTIRMEPKDFGVTLLSQFDPEDFSLCSIP